MYRALIEAIPHGFPAAQKLVITLRTVLNGWENWSKTDPAPFPACVDQADETKVKNGILEPLDAMYGCFISHLKELQVILTPEVFDVVAHGEQVHGTGVTYNDHEMDPSKWDQFFRYIGIDSKEVGYWVLKQPPMVVD
jgi:hypothetical protein